MKSESEAASVWIERVFLLSAAAALYFIGGKNYLLFHGLVEISSVAVCWIVFTIAWNSRAASENEFLKFLGIAYFFIGLFDLLHTLAYAGMGVYSGNTTNLATQLWIAARWMESLSLLSAQLFFRRRVHPPIVFFGFASISALVLASIFKWDIFPACFIEGAGLTTFKKTSEYLISTLLLGAGGAFYANRDKLDDNVLKLMALSIGVSIFSELTFTLYTSPYGPFNFTGHLLKTFSIFLVYKALVETGLKKPYDLLFRNLKQREQSLLESEARYVSITESTPDRILTLDENLNIVFSNQRVAEFSKDELIGKPISLLLPDSESEILLKELETVLKTGKLRRNVFEHVDKNGKKFYIEAVAAPIKTQTAAGREKLTVSARDISDRVRAEQERLKCEERLNLSHKLEALGTLAGGVAHDFNNILMSIIGFTDLVLLSTPDDDPRREDLNRVSQAALRARDIVRQILAFSSKTQSNPKPLNFTKFLPEAMKLIRASIPATTAIQEDIAEEPCFVMADSTQIHQVVMNLCSNAYHAVKDVGGQIDVKLDWVELDAEKAAKIPGLSKGVYVRLSVADTGSGIDDSLKAKIFDPYFTTKKVGEGSGLGLAVAHGIVVNHKGVLTFESEKGRGSKFMVYLPKIDFFTEEECEAVQEITGGDERILFVEDDPLVAAFGDKFLRRLGYQSTVSENSPKALEIFKKDPFAWDIVVTDQTMHAMTGDELAKNMLALRPDLPVLLCTGHSPKINAEKAKALGVRALLQKPITCQDLAAAIRDALDSSEKPAKKD